MKQKSIARLRCPFRQWYAEYIFWGVHINTRQCCVLGGGEWGRVGPEARGITETNTGHRQSGGTSRAKVQA